MSYNSARDELFFADWENRVVRVIGVRRDNAGDLRDVYKTGDDSYPQSVCHMKDSDTLLVGEWHRTSEESGDYWLVALSRSGSEWRETHRLQLHVTSNNRLHLCALSDSRVLCGQYRSTYLELLRADVAVESGARVASVRRLDVTEEYLCFSATCGSDALVAMSY